MSLEAGQKIRIEGKTYDVKTVSQFTLWGKRNTRVILELTEEIEPKDVKPSEVSENINKLLGYPLANPSEEDIKQMAQEFLPWVKSFWADLEKAAAEARSQ